MKIVITGSAGFIGFSLAKYLLEKKIEVIGIDNINNYYSVRLKKERIKVLKKFKNFSFFKADLTNKNKIEKFFYKKKIYAIYHLAAQVGVRYSVDFPRKYIDSNINGFFNILEIAKNKKIKKFFYASSSSVYGNSKFFPLKEELNLYPTNTYSLSKKFNEELVSIYSNYYKLSAVGLRFFTVYGEWGRPDMFYSKVLDAGFKNKKLFLNNYGNHFRDFTYINDVVFILFNLLKSKKIKHNDVINLCSNNPIDINNIIKLVEQASKKIEISKRPMQKADVLKTHGDNTKIIKYKLIKKFTPLKVGIRNTIMWYKNFHKFK